MCMGNAWVMLPMHCPGCWGWYKTRHIPCMCMGNAWVSPMHCPGCWGWYKTRAVPGQNVSWAAFRLGNAWAECKLGSAWAEYSYAGQCLGRMQLGWAVPGQNASWAEIRLGSAWAECMLGRIQAGQCLGRMQLKPNQCMPSQCHVWVNAHTLHNNRQIQ